MNGEIRRTKSEIRNEHQARNSNVANEELSCLEHSDIRALNSFRISCFEFRIDSMSDHEFENYLTLLSRLLRLSGKQRDQISDELRAHLEDRLEELKARGVSHEAAVRQALEEFGDAAGLAGQFVAISWNRKRRWLVRLTTFSVAATLLLAAGIAIFWPGRNAAPGVARAVAQNPKPGGTDPSGPPAKPSNDKRTAEARIEEELNKQTTLEVVETPLKDVVAFIQDNHSIPIVLKTKQLEEVGISLDIPITKNLKGIRLRSALNLILDDLDLTYFVKDEVLQISTPDDAQSTMETRVYDCRDLLAMPAPGRTPAPGVPGGFGGRIGSADAGAAAVPGGEGAAGGVGTVADHAERAAQLMSIITTNVDWASWVQNVNMMGGGNGMGGMGTHIGANPPTEKEWRRRGSISEYNGLLVITTNAQTHKKIEHVLDMLREAAGLDAAKSGKVVR